MTSETRDPKVWPLEIRLNQQKSALSVTFGDGQSFALSAEFLRVVSPSAEVQGHTPSERQTVPGKQDVKILKVEPVGHYAIRITFDDGHNTGIYSWPYLREIADSHEQLWQGYLDELAAKNLSRSRR